MGQIGKRKNKTGKNKEETMQETNNTVEWKETPNKESNQEAMIRKAFEMYMHMEAKKKALKEPHQLKTKKARRAKNKVQRASRRKNR